jgi:calcium and integrin-binding protein 1
MYSEKSYFDSDFDGDDMLGIGDLQQVIERLTGPQRLSDIDTKQLIQNLLEEADLDDDGSLSYAEFEHIISKSPDFTR